MQRKPLPKPPKDNRQVKEYTSAARRGLDSHFITHTDEGWVVRRPNATRSSSSGRFVTKSDAVAHAKKMASAGRGDIFIFTKDGRLAEHRAKK